MMALWDLVGRLNVSIESRKGNAFDPVNEVLFYNDEGNALYRVIDVSDPANLSVRSTVGTSNDRFPWGASADPSIQVIIIGGVDFSAEQSFADLWDYSDPSNLSLLDTVSTEDEVAPQLNINAEDQHAYATYQSSTTDEGILFLDYGGSTLLENGKEFSPSGFPSRHGIYDPTNDLYYAGFKDRNTNDRTVHAFQVSAAGDFMSHLDGLQGPANGAMRDAAVDEGRALVMYVSGGGFRIAEWDGSTFSIVGSADPGFAEPRSIALHESESIAYLAGDNGGSGPTLAKVDVSDKTNPVVVDTAETYNNDPATPSTPRGLFLYKSGSRLIICNEGTDDVAVLDTAFVQNDPPDKPTCTVDSVDQRGGDLSSSAFSDPDGDPHDSSRWQVRDNADTDWSSPAYDSGWTASDLTSHTTDRDLTPGTGYEARVAHRDPSGAFTWSDPVAFTTEALDRIEAIGPEGFFFGGANRNDLLKFGEVHEDAGEPITGRALHRAVAPQGAAAEALFVAARVTITYETEFQVTFTPVLDGEEITAEAVSTTRQAPAEQTTETFEVSFNRSVSGGTRQGLRGTWIRTLVEVVETLSAGGYVSIDGIEYEWEPVRESLPELTFHQESLSPASPNTVTPFYFGVGDSLGRFGGSRNDLGTAVSARAESNLLAPAGSLGECLFTNLYLALTRANASDLPLDVTAIVDEVEHSLPTITLSGVADPVLEVIEVPLTDAYVRDAIERSRHHLRGTWFGLRLDTSGLLPDGDVIFEGAELAYEVVQESEEAVNV